MAVSALLRAGVLARADTSARASVQVIEVATRHGWNNNDYRDNALIGPAVAGSPDPDLDARLTRSRGEALAWLRAHAVPPGYVMIDRDNLIVLDRPA
ncbi:hypothetical protein L3Q67_02300 [Saccharothrix sp. AJ9571]|nr:hypothetical protein L3Q67_02300 [Saccharothrix sp. AJ9571]